MAFETTTLFTKKNVFAALAVASVLLLSTGCAPELLVGGAGGSGSGSSSDSDSQDGSKTDSDTEGDGDDSASVNLTGKACFPGEWLVDNKNIQAYMESVSSGASVATTGRVILTYNADGTSVTNYDRWTHTMKVEGGTSVVERHGIDQGTYTATESGTFSGADTSIGSVTKMTATGAGGESIAMSVDPEPSVFNSGKYTCSGNTMTVIVDGYTLGLSRQR